jgi:hypothetical protein
MIDEELTMLEVDLINEGDREKRRIEKMGIATWETESKMPELETENEEEEDYSTQQNELFFQKLGYPLFLTQTETFLDSLKRLYLDPNTVWKDYWEWVKEGKDIAKT